MRQKSAPSIRYRFRLLSLLPRNSIISRAIKVALEEEPRIFWLRLLRALGFWMVLWLEQPSDEPVPNVDVALPIAIDLLREDEVDEYLRFRSDTWRSLVEARLKEGRRCFVVRHEGRIVAATWVATRTASLPSVGLELPLASDEAYLFDAFTLPELRGRNISPALSAHILRCLRQEGFRRAILGAALDRPRALRAHSKAGFRRSAVLVVLKVGPWRWRFWRTKHRQPLSRSKLLCHPGFPYRAVVGSTRQSPEPFASSSVTFYQRGCTALWHGLKLLRLRPGQTVLFPSYHCGIELDVILRAGFQVAFYRVGRDLRFDLDDLRRAASPDTRAVYVTHYFGFPHPLEAVQRLCEEQRWELIEDCAQALFAQFQGRAAGTSGDIAIFSLHKSLPVPRGGVLIVNSSDLPRPEAAGHVPLPCVAYYTLALLMRDLRHLPFTDIDSGYRVLGLIARIARRLQGKQASQSPDPLVFYSDLENTRIPGLSLRLFRRIGHAQVRRRRRLNFRALLPALAGCERIAPLIPCWMPGACPPYFPVTIRGEVPEFLEHCQSWGVQAYPFWHCVHPQFPVERFPEAGWLKRQTVALPVHQDLRETDLELLRQLIAAWEQARP